MPELGENDFILSWVDPDDPGNETSLGELQALAGFYGFTLKPVAEHFGVVAMADDEIEWVSAGAFSDFRAYHPELSYGATTSSNLARFLKTKYEPDVRWSSHESYDELVVDPRWGVSHFDPRYIVAKGREVAEAFVNGDQPVTRRVAELLVDFCNLELRAEPPVPKIEEAKSGAETLLKASDLVEFIEPEDIEFPMPVTIKADTSSEYLDVMGEGDHQIHVVTSEAIQRYWQWVAGGNVRQMAYVQAALDSIARNHSNFARDVYARASARNQADHTPRSEEERRARQDRWPGEVRASLSSPSFKSGALVVASTANPSNVYGYPHRLHFGVSVDAFATQLWKSDQGLAKIERVGANSRALRPLLYHYLLEVSQPTAEEQ